MVWLLREWLFMGVAGNNTGSKGWAGRVGEMKSSSLATWGPGSREGPALPPAVSQDIASMPGTALPTICSQQPVGRGCPPFTDEEIEAHKEAPKAPSWGPGSLDLGSRAHVQPHDCVLLGHSEISGRWMALPGFGTSCWVASRGFHTVLMGNEWAPMPARRRGMGHAILEPALCTHAEQGA